MGKRSKIMLAYPMEERRLLEPKFGWKFPVIVQPKLDGERCRVVLESGKIVLRSSECNEIVSVPHINEFLQNIPDLSQMPELDGELYLHGWDFSDIHSVVSRRENIHDRSDLMQLHIFDFVSPAAQLPRTYQLTSYNWLNCGPVRLVPFDIAYSMAEIMDFYQQYLAKGYEGIIVRHVTAPYIRKRSRFLLKFKPKKDDYYKIIEVVEAVSNDGKPLQMIGAFWCVGTDGTPFKVGAGMLTRQKRWDLWEDRDSQIGQFCHTQYQNVTVKGALRFGLCISVVEKNPEEASFGGIL